MSEQKIIDNILSRGIAQIIDKDVLRKKLEKDPSQVFIKYGLDPTRPDIHIGHAVCLRKLRQFQDLGCTIIFLVGDFTAMIGDPTGKNKLRPELGLQEIQQNMATYVEQAQKILNWEKNIAVLQNASWFMTFDDFWTAKGYPIPFFSEETFNEAIKGGAYKNVLSDTISIEEFQEQYITERTLWETQGNKMKQVVSLRNLLGNLRKVTQEQLIQRDLFKERRKKNIPIFMNEMLYPIIQGIDSLVISKGLLMNKALKNPYLVEMGGTDQYFNILMGRQMVEKDIACEMELQSVITVPIIEGLDGKEKMSKSLDNYIGVTEIPSEIFGKVMSIPDELMEKYFELLTDEDMKEVKKLIKKSPRDAKVRLAKNIVTWLHDKKCADEALRDFEQKFVKKEVPDEMPEFSVGKSEVGILDLITSICKFTKSNSDARRLVQQSAVTWNGEKVTDPNAMIQISGEHVLKAGKRSWARIKK